MKILLYGVPADIVGRVAVRYGFRATDAFDEPDGAADVMSTIPPMTSPGQLLSCYDARIARQAETDAVIVCDSGNSDACSTVRYGASPGKLFTLCADADGEALEYELGRIVEALSGRLCAHEGIE